MCPRPGRISWSVGEGGGGRTAPGEDCLREGEGAERDEGGELHGARDASSSWRCSSSDELR